MNINFKDKKTITLMITAGTLILLTAAIVAIVFLFPAKKIEIPDFSNKSKVDVDAWILENDLTVEDVTFTYEYNETTEKDMVLSQSILAGEKLKKDEVLNIILSNGYDPTLVVTIPDFKDMKYEEIHQWFTDNKFTDVTYEYIPDQKVKKDYFIKSNLTASEAHRNDMILISISVGTESVGVEITMPDFADYTKANIQAWGKTNNMSITFKTEASDKIAKDKVISQTPKAGETTKTGGKVTVTISTGKGTTAVKFDGKTKKDVDAWAKENGIKISYVEAYDNKIANGTVISNKPNSGTIATGSTMTVNISIGKPSIDNYTNKSKASFQTYIDGLNKKSANIKIVATEVDSTATPGTIVKQTINNKVVSGSTSVDTGTTVYIDVARTESKNVPSYAGKAESTFKTEIVNTYKMKVGSATSKYSDSITNGSIISNDTGTKTVGTSINYVVSIGAYAYKDGDYNGKTKAQADSFISTENNKGAGISIKYTEAFNNSVTSGTIYGCSYSNKVVSCNLSLGKSISVPDYVGQNKKPCNMNSCTVDGLNVTIKFVDSDKDVDTVLDQSLKAGSNVAEGSAITVTLSNGKNKKTCPAGASGTYPNCVCPSGQEYDSATNTCKAVAVTSGPLPIFNLAIYDGQSYSQITSALTTRYNSAGFKNLNFVQLTGEIDNPDNSNGVAEINPEPNGADTSFSTQITIKIWVSK